MRWMNSHGGIRVADECHQLGVEVELANGHHIDDAHGNSVSQQGSTLADKGISLLRPILVRWANDLDSCDEGAAAPSVVDTDFVLVVLRRFGLDVRARDIMDMLESRPLAFRPGDVARRKGLPELLDHAHGPAPE